MFQGQVETDSNNAILLIDDKNAFGSLNSHLALKNVETLCPSIHKSLQRSKSTSIIFTAI